MDIAQHILSDSRGRPPLAKSRLLVLGDGRTSIAMLGHC